MALSLTRVVMTLAALGMGMAQAADDPLARWRWQSRVLVVLAPEAGDTRLLEQRRLWQQDAGGRRERDIVTVEALGDLAGDAAVRHRFGVPQDGFAVVLVGKDGGEKYRADRPVRLAEVYAVIDAMPMRRQEMSRQPGHG